jgi:hypothetical protein
MKDTKDNNLGGPNDDKEILPTNENCARNTNPWCNGIVDGRYMMVRRVVVSATTSDFRVTRGERIAVEWHGCMHRCVCVCVQGRRPMTRMVGSSQRTKARIASRNATSIRSQVLYGWDGWDDESCSFWHVT